MVELAVTTTISLEIGEWNAIQARLKEADRLLRLLRLFGNENGAHTGEILDWLNDEYGQPWQHCDIPGCRDTRKCLLPKHFEPKYGPCHSTAPSAGVVQ